MKKCQPVVQNWLHDFKREEGEGEGGRFTISTESNIPVLKLMCRGLCSIRLLEHGQHHMLCLLEHGRHQRGLNLLDLVPCQYFLRASQCHGKSQT